MAAASSFYSPMALRYLPAPYTHRPSVSHLRANLLLPRYPFRRPVVVFSRRRNKTISAITSSNKNEQMVPRNESIKGDGVDENALDSSFSLQEEDLENDDPSLAELESELDKDLAELEREFEDLAKLERLLDKALQALSDDEEEDDDDDDDDDEEKKQMMPYNEVTKEDDVDEDALQSPFTQKEEDLENDDPSLAKLELELEGDLAKLESEFEEDLAKLERELDKVLQALSDDEEEEEEEEEDDDDNDGGEKLVMLPKNLQRLNHNEVTKEDDADPDALEALFSKLEEDLENGDPYLDDGDGEIDEKDLAKLERELVKALGDDKLLGAFDSLENDEVNKKVEDGDGDDDDDGDNDDDAGKKLVKLKNWQLRRLAYALKNGRRKISIKNLAAELCLDRAVVLQLLRNPPASLLLMSAALPDKLISPISEPESKPLETVSSEIVADVPQPETDLVVPVHAMQSSWSARKRLKKVQVDTLQRVYARTKRPTNAMVSSIVHVTNLPRKRVVKWFEDKRTEDGVPDHRHPYQRSAPQTVFNSSKK